VLNPTWTVIFLDDQSVSTLLDLSDIEAVDLPIQKRANVLRTRLLREYGGVWCDASLLCAAPLDSWLYFALQADMFAFSRPSRDRIIANWFLVSIKGGEMISAIDEAYTRYLTDPPVYREGPKPPYFNYHFTVEYLYLAHPQFRSRFRLMPKISAAPPHKLSKWLKRQQASPDAPVPDFRGIPMHKLNWRASIDLRYLRAIAERLDERLGSLPVDRPTSDGESRMTSSSSPAITVARP
jgi:hypothetical protein